MHRRSDSLDALSIEDAIGQIAELVALGLARSAQTRGASVGQHNDGLCGDALPLLLTAGQVATFCGTSERPHLQGPIRLRWSQT